METALGSTGAEYFAMKGNAVEIVFLLQTPGNIYSLHNPMALNKNRQIVLFIACPSTDERKIDLLCWHFI